MILSGPSGVGKDTVIDAWRAEDSRVQRVVAYTTRAPRPGEVDGIDYNFRTVEEFLAMADRGEFLEFKEVHGNWYATPLKDMEQMLQDGKVAILKIDVQGALSVMDLRKDALTVFLLPPSSEELERRIRGRGTESQDIIERRLQNARDEIAVSDKYQFKVINRNISETVEELEGIVA